MVDLVMLLGLLLLLLLGLEWLLLLLLLRRLLLLLMRRIELHFRRQMLLLLLLGVLLLLQLGVLVGHLGAYGSGVLIRRGGVAVGRAVILGRIDEVADAGEVLRVVARRVRVRRLNVDGIHGWLLAVLVRSSGGRSGRGRVSRGGGSSKGGSERRRLLI